MSTITLKPLKQVSKLEVPEQTRLLRVIHKGDGKESRGAFVPLLSETTIQSLLLKPEGLEWFRNKVEAVQEQIVRKLNCTTFDSEQIQFDGILAFITAENVSTRFSKEAIETWFQADMIGFLQAALKEKGITEEDKLKQITNSFMASFCLLAGRNPSMPEAIKDQLVKCLALLPDEYVNTVAERIAEKLSTVQEATVLIDAL